MLARLLGDDHQHAERGDLRCSDGIACLEVVAALLEQPRHHAHDITTATRYPTHTACLQRSGDRTHVGSLRQKRSAAHSPGTAPAISRPTPHLDPPARDRTVPSRHGLNDAGGGPFTAVVSRGRTAGAGTGGWAGSLQKQRRRSFAGFQELRPTRRTPDRPGSRRHRSVRRLWEN